MNGWQQRKHTKILPKLERALCRELLFENQGSQQEPLSALHISSSWGHQCLGVNLVMLIYSDVLDEWWENLPPNIIKKHRKLEFAEILADFSRVVVVVVVRTIIVVNMMKVRMMTLMSTYTLIMVTVVKRWFRGQWLFLLRMVHMPCV